MISGVLIFSSTTPFLHLLWFLGYTQVNIGIIAVNCLRQRRERHLVNLVIAGKGNTANINSLSHVLEERPLTDLLYRAWTFRKDITVSCHGSHLWIHRPFQDSLRRKHSTKTTRWLSDPVPLTHPCWAISFSELNI